MSGIRGRGSGAGAASREQRKPKSFSLIPVPSPPALIRMPALPSLRQLSYLVELAARLNFREAAEAQFVTQSTLSAGIKELETALGVQLVERNRRNVRLTAVGEDVVARARGVLAAAVDLAEAA